jgi:hypothetical protein
MSVEDDYGRYSGNVKALRSQVYPLRVDEFSEKHIEKYIEECQKANLISVYTDEDGKVYIVRPDKSHPPRTKQSKWPEPPDGILCWREPADLQGQTPSWSQNGPKNIERDQRDSNNTKMIHVVPNGTIRYQMASNTNTNTNNDKEKNIKKESGGQKRAKGTLEELKAYCVEIGLTESDGEWKFDQFEANGWTNNGKPVRDYRAHIRTWKRSGYFPSQKVSPDTRLHQSDVQKQLDKFKNKDPV